MNHPPPDNIGPQTSHSAWMSTTPSRFLDDPSPAPRLSLQPYPQRKPQAQALTSQAHVWLARLPPHFQPLATARRHPYIINRLSEMWDKPSGLPAHLHDLMLSSRPSGRDGFAFEVLSELADLLNLAEAMQKGEKF